MKTLFKPQWKKNALIDWIKSPVEGCVVVVVCAVVVSNSLAYDFFFFLVCFVFIINIFWSLEKIVSARRMQKNNNFLKQNLNEKKKTNKKSPIDIFSLLFSFARGFLFLKIHVIYYTILRGNSLDFSIIFFCLRYIWNFVYWTPTNNNNINLNLIYYFSSSFGIKYKERRHMSPDYCE